MAHRIRSRVAAASIALVVATSTLVVLSAPMATALNVINVTTPADGVAGSLRAAINTANADGDDSEIVLQSGVTYLLGLCPGTDEDLNVDGDLDHIADGEALTITGNGATIVQTCSGERVIDDHGNGLMTLLDVTITGGSPAGSGGGVRTHEPATFDGVTVSGNAAGSDGGGIDSPFGATLIDSRIIGNTADGVGGGASLGGGGSSVSITNSTISGNTAGDAGGGISAGGAGSTTFVVGTTISGNTSGAEGGGVAAGGDGSAHEYRNSTISGNTAVMGGGIASSRDAGILLIYATVASNNAPTGANLAIYSFGTPEQMDWGKLVSFGSVVSDPIGGSACRLPGDPTESAGYNYDTDGSCGFGPGAGDVDDGPDPLLGPLADNGGTTLTRLPIQGSALIDAIPLAACHPLVIIDQRGVSRPQDGNLDEVDQCDIGAVEVDVVRIWGQDAIDTSIAISEVAFPAADSANAVVLARSDFFSDALAGGPLAANKGGPLLITPGAGLSSSLDPRVRAEIERVLPGGGTVYILGGTLALAPGIDTTLQGLGFVVERIFGPNLFSTAVAIADELGNPPTIFEATGLDFPDALSAVPAAIKTGGAILLTNGTTQAPETAEYLATHSPPTRYAIGGPLAAWGADPAATPVYGDDLYDTSAAVGTTFFPVPVGFGLATGLHFPDALSGGVFMATGGRLGPVLLVNIVLPVPTSIAAYIAAMPPTPGYVFGGTLAIPEAVVAAVMALR